MEILQIGQQQIAYWDAGTGIPIVFIHGVGTSGEQWAADLFELAADFHIIVYNRRGYGASSSSPRNWDAHVEDAVVIIETLDVAPAVVVGYSSGAAIAIGLMLKRSDLVRGLILLDPAMNLQRHLTNIASSP